MDSARNISTGDIVDAESLWDLDAVNKDDYECHGCGVKVWPASYQKDVNLKRPYFKLSPGAIHIVPCGVDGMEKQIERAKTQRIGTEQGFPFSYPNKLVLTDVRPVVASNDSEATSRELRNGNGVPDQGSRASRVHRHTVKTIRPICRTFLNFPHDREFMSLDVPNCPGSTFTRVFWRLSSKPIVQFASPTHLYFAPLQWRAPLVGEAIAEWSLGAGEWDEAARGWKRAYRVRFDWEQWPPRQREILRHEIEVARHEIKGKPGKVKAWLFFVGTQDAADPSLLVVTRFQLACCLVAEMLYPSQR